MLGLQNLIMAYGSKTGRDTIWRFHPQQMTKRHQLAIIDITCNLQSLQIILCTLSTAVNWWSVIIAKVLRIGGYLAYIRPRMLWSPFSQFPRSPEQVFIRSPCYRETLAVFNDKFCTVKHELEISKMVSIQNRLPSVPFAHFAHSASKILSKQKAGL